MPIYPGHAEKCESTSTQGQPRACSSCTYSIKRAERMHTCRRSRTLWAKENKSIVFSGDYGRQGTWMDVGDFMRSGSCPVGRLARVAPWARRWSSESLGVAAVHGGRRRAVRRRRLGSLCDRRRAWIRLLRHQHAYAGMGRKTPSERRRLSWLQTLSLF